MLTSKHENFLSQFVFSKMFLYYIKNKRIKVFFFLKNLKKNQSIIKILKKFFVIKSAINLKIKICLSQ